MMNHERENENSFQYLKALRDLQRTPNSPEAQDAMERAKEHHRGHTDSQCTSEADLLKALAPSWLCYVEAVPGRRIPSADIARAEAKAIAEAKMRLRRYAEQSSETPADIVRQVTAGMLTPSVILAALEVNSTPPARNLSEICSDEAIRAELQNENRGTCKLSDAAVTWLREHWEKLLPASECKCGAQRVSDALKSTWNIRISKTTIQSFRQSFSIFN